MPLLYKDYNKTSKEVLSLGFNKGGEWLIGNVTKPSKGAYSIASTATASGVVNVGVEGLTTDGAYYGKLTLTPGDVPATKATVRAEDFQGQRIEAVIGPKGATLGETPVQLSHQTVKPLAGGRLSVHDTITQKTVDLGMSLAAMDNLEFGGGALYDIKSQTAAWTAACRATTANGVTVMAQTAQLSTFTADVVARAPLHPKFSPRIAATVTVNPSSQAWDGTVAMEWECQVILGNTAKARINKSCEWALSYMATLQGGWLLSVSVDQSLKAGVMLTRV